MGLGLSFFFISTAFSPVSDICADCAHAGFSTTLFSSVWGERDVIPVIPPLDSGSVGDDSSVYDTERSSHSRTLHEFFSRTSLFVG